MSLFLKPSPAGALLKVYVQPRASKEGIAGQHGEALKIKLKAPPVEGEANAACLRFLATLLGLPATNLFIKSGHRSRLKFIEIQGLSPDEIRKVIATHLAPSL